MKRIIYLIYYIKKLDWNKFRKFLFYAKQERKISVLQFWGCIIHDSLKYNISPMEYFHFGFYNMEHIEKKKWAGTGFMYEYQLKMNPKSSRVLLENKISFLNHFQQFVHRRFLAIQPNENTEEKLKILFSNQSGKLVLKNAMGQVGAEVEVIKCSDYTPQTLIKYMQSKNYNLAEEFVIQHPALMKLSPSGLNTVRIFTQLHEGKVVFLGARLRISVNSAVDNMAAGNLAAALNMESGEVTGAGVYSDITKPDESIHPVTGKTIIGFKVPYWYETLEMIKSAALLNPENKSVGWDIAITAIGPELIEGNHNWCKLLWQLPVKQGLKHLLVPYLKEN
jgi:hypothetical protein